MNSSRRIKNLNESPQRKHKSRVVLINLFFVLSFFVIIIKLYSIQIIKHDIYAKRYKEQSRKKINIFAPKGNIYDRNYNKLAENIGVNYAFGINTKRVSNCKDLAKRIATITGEDHRSYYKTLKSKKGFIWVTRKLNEKQREKILDILNEEESSAASFKVTANRVYPQGKVGGQIVGYTDIDGKGMSGIEKEFDEYLTGQDGWEYIYKDARQNKSFSSTIQKKLPGAGNSVILTIDNHYQAIVEEELENVVKKWKANKAAGIIMDPQTGEILAMSSYPNFDPNNPGEYTAFERKNKAITDIYEPGSTLKGITAGMLFEENLVDEEEMFFCSNEGVKIGNRTIKDSHKNEEENMSFREVIAHSSNVGTVKAVLKMDDSKFYEYLRSFGFGDKTDIKLTGEVKGMLLKLRNWSKTSKPTMSFGQGISVTPLQLASSYCAIANGGKLLKPMLVKGIIDKNNKVIKKYDPQVIRKVFSEKTTARVRNLLRGVVEFGSAPLAEIPGLRVGGKTGTSQKVVNGKYSKKDYDASFVGMIPYDNPRLVCLIVVDSPKPYHWGGTVAAPVFKNIVERIYNEHKSKVFIDEKNYVRYKDIPDLLNKDIEEVSELLNNKGINYKYLGKNSKVLYQSKKPYSLISPMDTLIISDRLPEYVDESVNLVPSVLNLSLREAVNKMHKAGIETRVFGSGNVFEQSLHYGINENTAKICSLYCKPLIPQDKLTAKIGL
ncbi:MAG: hypothetical protein JXR69_00440 [Candidatus Delongbacteria bacterium]|nr:hypothetical protein [Candidatus Delongbacteria bacterium]